MATAQQIQQLWIINHLISTIRTWLLTLTETVWGEWETDVHSLASCSPAKEGSNTCSSIGNTCQRHPQCLSLARQLLQALFEPPFPTPFLIPSPILSSPNGRNSNVTQAWLGRPASYFDPSSGLCYLVERCSDYSLWNVSNKSQVSENSHDSVT